MSHRTELSLFLMSIGILCTLPAVTSQSSGCYFTATNIYGPPSVQEERKFEVQTLFSVTCTGPGLYTVRADIADSRTGQILSTSRMTYSILGPFAAVVTSTLQAPKTTGWWSLQMNLYVLTLTGIPIGPQSQQLFGLSVVTASP